MAKAGNELGAAPKQCSFLPYGWLFNFIKQSFSPSILLHLREREAEAGPQKHRDTPVLPFVYGRVRVTWWRYQTSKEGIFNHEQWDIGTVRTLIQIL